MKLKVLSLLLIVAMMTAMLSGCSAITPKISFTVHDISLIVGEQGTLSTDSDPTGFNIDSQDSDVCTISGDTVTAIAPGETTITIYKNDTLCDTCNVSVTLPPIDAITIDTQSFDAKIGHSSDLLFTYSPTDSPEPDVTWSVSDDTVAEIKDGKIQWLAEGTVTIEAVVDGMDILDSVTVEVEPIEVESVAVEDITLTMGETEQVIAAVSPSDATNPTLDYISGNNSVFTVSDDGIVTGVYPGTATLYAGVSQEIYGEATVTVKGIEAKSVTISGSGNSHSIYRGDGIQLYASVLPENTFDQTISWSSSNPKIAKVSENGYVTGVGVGNATITAKTTNGRRATYLISVSLQSEPLPSNGEILYKNNSYSNWANSLTIVNEWDRNVVFVIKEDAKTWVETVFVRAGQSATISLPYGSFRVKYAASDSWYGYYNQQYDPNCSFYIYYEGLSFPQSSTIYYQMTYTLYTTTFPGLLGGDDVNEVPKATYDAW